MSNLSDFIGGAGGGGIYLGYIETADGSFEKIADGKIMAYIDYAELPVSVSGDGVSSFKLSEGDKRVFSDGIWVKKDEINNFAILSRSL